MFLTVFINVLLIHVSETVSSRILLRNFFEGSSENVLLVKINTGSFATRKMPVSQVCSVLISRSEK